MRTMTRILGSAAVGALVAAGCITAPAQAAVIVKPVTTGYAQFVIQAPAGVQPDWVSADPPGRVTSQGLIFPIGGVTSDGKTVTLKGAMALRAPDQDPIPYGVQLRLDRVTRDMSVFHSAYNESYAVFFSKKMKVTTSVKVNKEKKSRTTTQIWTGDLQLRAGTAADHDYADSLNSAFHVTSFSPGMSLGQVALKVSTTTPCKDQACTK